MRFWYYWAKVALRYHLGRWYIWRDVPDDILRYSAIALYRQTRQNNDCPDTYQILIEARNEMRLRRSRQLLQKTRQQAAIERARQVIAAFDVSSVPAIVETPCPKCGRVIYCGVNKLCSDKECGLKNAK